MANNDRILLQFKGSNGRYFTMASVEHESQVDDMLREYASALEEPHRIMAGIQTEARGIVLTGRYQSNNRSR